MTPSVLLSKKCIVNISEILTGSHNSNDRHARFFSFLFFFAGRRSTFSADRLLDRFLYASRPGVGLVRAQGRSLRTVRILILYVQINSVFFKLKFRITSVGVNTYNHIFTANEKRAKRKEEKLT